MNRIRIGEAARILNVSVQTLRRWDKLGILRAKTFESSNQRFYTQEQLDRFRLDLFSTFAFFKGLLFERYDTLEEYLGTVLGDYFYHVHFENVPLYFMCRVNITPVNKDTTEYFFICPLREGVKDTDGGKEAFLALLAAHGQFCKTNKLEFVTTNGNGMVEDLYRTDMCRDILKDAIEYAHTFMNREAKKNPAFDKLLEFLHGSCNGAEVDKFLVLDRNPYTCRLSQNGHNGTKIDFLIVTPVR